MAFTDIEITNHALTIEKHFWSLRRPPLQLRDKVREGQRIAGQDIELFFVRPAFGRRGEFIESSIAKLRYIRSSDHWQILWKRADGKWHRYQPCPESKTLEAALRIIHEDAYQCFFG